MVVLLLPLTAVLPLPVMVVSPLPVTAVLPLPVVVGFQLGLVALLVLVGHGNVGRLLIIIGLLPHLPHLHPSSALLP